MKENGTEELLEKEKKQKLLFNCFPIMKVRFCFYFIVYVNADCSVSFLDSKTN